MNKPSLLRSALAAGAYAFAASGIALAQAGDTDPASDNDVKVIIPSQDITGLATHSHKNLNFFHITCPNNPDATHPTVIAKMEEVLPQYLKDEIARPKLENRPEEEWQRDWYDVSAGLIGKDGTLYPAYNHKELQAIFADALEHPEKLAGAPRDNIKARQAVVAHARKICLGGS